MVLVREKHCTTTMTTATGTIFTQKKNPCQGAENNVTLGGCQNSGVVILHFTCRSSCSNKARWKRTALSSRIENASFMLKADFQGLNFSCLQGLRPLTSHRNPRGRIQNCCGDCRGECWGRWVVPGKLPGTAGGSARGTAWDLPAGRRETASSLAITVSRHSPGSSLGTAPQHSPQRSDFPSTRPGSLLGSFREFGLRVPLANRGKSMQGFFFLGRHTYEA